MANTDKEIDIAVTPFADIKSRCTELIRELKTTCNEHGSNKLYTNENGGVYVCCCSVLIVNNSLICGDYNLVIGHNNVIFGNGVLTIGENNIWTWIDRLPTETEPRTSTIKELLHTNFELGNVKVLLNDDDFKLFINNVTISNIGAYEALKIYAKTLKIRVTNYQRYSKLRKASNRNNDYNLRTRIIPPFQALPLDRMTFELKMWISLCRGQLNNVSNGCNFNVDSMDMDNVKHRQLIYIQIFRTEILPLLNIEVINEVL